MTRESGLIDIPPKLLSRLHELELEGTALTTRLRSIDKESKALIESFLEDGCGVDLDAEHWIPEVAERRFRRADVRPPELRPENEVVREAVN